MIQKETPPWYGRLFYTPTAVTWMHVVIYMICVLPGMYLFAWTVSISLMLLPVALVIGYLLAFVIFMSLHSLVRWILPFPSINRSIPFDTTPGSRFMLLIANYQLLACVTYSPFWFFINILFFPLKHFYRLHGARIAQTAQLAPNITIYDPWCLDIKDSAIIGLQCNLLGHYRIGNQIHFGKIHIDQHVTLGAQSIILPKVHIKQRAMIGIHSLLLPNTVVEADEFWAGMPAVKKERKNKQS